MQLLEFLVLSFFYYNYCVDFLDNGFYLINNSF